MRDVGPYVGIGYRVLCGQRCLEYDNHWVRGIVIKDFLCYNRLDTCCTNLIRQKTSIDIGKSMAPLGRIYYLGVNQIIY